MRFHSDFLYEFAINEIDELVTNCDRLAGLKLSKFKTRAKSVGFKSGINKKQTFNK